MKQEDVGGGVGGGGKVRRKREANFQTRFGRWVVTAEARPFVGGGGSAFELKSVLAGRGLAFSAVKEHQVEALRRARGLGDVGVLYHKISDMAVGFKPCDCVVVSGGGGWLGVEWGAEVRGGAMGFYLIDVEAWAEIVEEGDGSVGGGARAKAGRSRSMSEAQAGEIGTFIPWETS